MPSSAKALDGVAGDSLDDQSIQSTDTLDMKEVRKARNYHYRPKRRDEYAAERYLLSDKSQEMASIQARQREQVKVFEQIRDRQERIARIDEQVRQYDTNSRRRQHLMAVKASLGGVVDNWKQVQAQLQEKLKMCRDIHAKHRQEVNQYCSMEEVFDEELFGRRVERSIGQLKKE